MQERFWKGEAMTRTEVLQAAEKCVTGQRAQDYGTIEDNFSVIAHLWSDYKGVGFTPVDVAMMMALLKIARIKSGAGTDDSFVDLAGYAACGGELYRKPHHAEGLDEKEIGALLENIYDMRQKEEKF